MSSSQKHLPYFAEGLVVPGFGRGSKELGIPTANFPDDVIQKLPADFECGVYYGWAKVSGDETIYKMVLCVGWNPYYHNTVKTMETHIIHKFDHDLYGLLLKTVILGYIRPMTNFESLDALIAAIHKDIADAEEHLAEPACLKYSHHPFFSQSPTITPPADHSSNPSMSSNSYSAATGLLNGDNHNSHHIKLSPASNGLAASSTKLDKYVHHCCDTGVIHCKSNHDVSVNHAKDKSCQSEREQEYHGKDNERLFTIPIKGSVSQEREISMNGHNESKESSSVCTLVV